MRTSESSLDAPTDAGFLAPPRVLRALSSAQAPYPGTLVAGAPTRVWVDATAFGDGPAWHADPRGHVLTPLDVARTATGHAVVLPHCTGRLADVLSRRDALEAGEAVTVAVSILRGAAEAERLGAEEGTWWLTEDLRPVLALTEGMPWRTATTALLADVTSRQHGELATALAESTETIRSERRLEHRIAALEDALFAAAAPEPLTNPTTTDPAHPRRVAVAQGPEPAEDDGEPSRRPLRAFLASQLGGELIDRVAVMFHGLRRRTRPASPVPRRRRRAPLVLAALIVVAILAVGLSWPADAQPETKRASTARASASRTPAAPTPIAAPAAEGAATSEPTPYPGDPASVPPDATAIVSRLAKCLASNDPACRAELLEDPARPIPEGIATTAADDREVTVLDDYGGVMALRVADARAPDAAQIMLIVRADERWLVRDVYDLADQP